MVDYAEFEKRLATLEAEPDPRRAEALFSPVIRALLEAEGYSVSDTGGPRDRGIDFLAIQPASSRGLPPRVGVQYKHLRTALGAATVEQVVEASSSSDLQRFLVISRTGFSRAARELLERELPVQLELVDFASLRTWMVRLADESEKIQPTAVEAINELSALLARIIARAPRELSAIEWRDLERMIATIFAKLGFATTLTPGSKDGGKDVVVRFHARGKDRSFIIEAKHWRSGQRVGSGYVTDFLKVVAREEYDGGLYIASEGYAGNAFESVTEIQRQTFHAGDAHKIVALCRTFVRAEAGLFTAPADLTEIISDDTLDL